MAFLVLAKHGLNKTWIRANLVSFLRDQTVERERGEEKREEEEEEEKKKRRDEEGEKFKQGQKGMELLNLSMDLWLV